MSIHKTSTIHRDAQICDDVTIGPNSYIGPKVFIDCGATIGPNVVIEGWTRIGKNCKIFSGAVLGGSPQIVNHKVKTSWVHIGEKTEIREFVTINRASEENGITSIGCGVYLMACVHVAHDCKIGDHVIATNFTGLSGHVVIEEKAVIGGYVAMHQFIRIGKMAMVGGMARLAQDVLPFSLVEGNPPRLYGINVVGLRRNKIAPSVRSGLKKAFRFIARSNLNTRQALERIKQEIPESEELKYLCDFIGAAKRGIHK